MADSARPRPSLATNIFGQALDTSKRLDAVVGRLMQCSECGAHVDVIEAAHGARSLAEHRFLDPESYVCGGCMTGGSPSGKEAAVVER